MDYSQETSLFKKISRSKEHKRVGWAIASIASIPLVMTLGNSMLIPVLPTMEKKLGISSFQSSMIITVYSIIAIILIPIAGYLSDRYGRKKVIIPSLIIGALGGLISGLGAWLIADSYWIILVGRVFQGVGAAGSAPIVMPLVGDMFKNEQEVSSNLGLIETSNTFGKVVSPILGAALAGVFWYLPFLAIPAFCFFSILMMLLFVKAPVAEKKSPPFNDFLKSIKEIFKNNGRWLYSIFAIGIILMFVLFGVLFFLSSMLEDKYTIKGIEKGLILAIPLAALCLSSFITGKKIKQSKQMMKWVTFISLLILGGAILALSFFDSIWILIGIFFISGIGIGAALPCLDALITEGIKKEERGTITSIYSSMRFIGVAAGPPVIAYLMNDAEKIMFYLLTALSLLGAFVTFLAIKPDKE